MASKICRVCLKKCSELASLGDDDGEKSLSDKLLFCVPELNLSIISDPVICGICLGNLRIAYDLRQTCLLSEEKIIKYLKNLYLESIKRTSEKNLVNLVHDGNAVTTANLNEYFNTTILEGASSCSSVTTSLSEDTFKYNLDKINANANSSGKSIQIIDVDLHPFNSSILEAISIESDKAAEDVKDCYVVLSDCVETSDVKIEDRYHDLKIPLRVDIVTEGQLNDPCYEADRDERGEAAPDNGPREKSNLAMNLDVKCCLICHKVFEVVEFQAHMKEEHKIVDEVKMRRTGRKKPRRDFKLLDSGKPSTRKKTPEPKTSDAGQNDDSSDISDKYIVECALCRKNLKSEDLEQHSKMCKSPVVSSPAPVVEVIKPRTRSSLKLPANSELNNGKEKTHSNGKISRKKKSKVAKVAKKKLVSVAKKSKKVLPKKVLSPSLSLKGLPCEIEPTLVQQNLCVICDTHFDDTESLRQHVRFHILS